MGLSLASFPRIPFSTGLDASKPSSPLTGDIFYATDTAINYQWNGSSWTSNSNLVPIGGIIPFLKSFTNTPTMPSNFVECNGQVLGDSASVYNGQTIPNLNNSGGNEVFLRGNLSSGITGGAETHNHIWLGSSGSFNGFASASGGGTHSYDSGGSQKNNIVPNYTSKDSSLPPYYTVVWIMRIK